MKELNDNPEPKAVDQLLHLVKFEDLEAISRTLIVGAVGEAAYIEPAVRARTDVIDDLYSVVLEDQSWVAKYTSARSLGLTLNDYAKNKLESFTGEGGGPIGPTYPPMPPGDTSLEYLQWVATVGLVGLQVTKSLVRLEGPNGNPFNFEDYRDHYLEDISKYLDAVKGQGCAP